MNPFLHELGNMTQWAIFLSKHKALTHKQNKKNNWQYVAAHVAHVATAAVTCRSFSLCSEIRVYSNWPIKKTFKHIKSINSHQV